MTSEELLRRLALNDEDVVRSAVAAEGLPLEDDAALDARTVELVRLAALLAVGAETASCRVAVEHGRAAGAGDPQLVAVLLAVAPAIGEARVVGAASTLALALDHDVEGLDTRWERPGT